VHTDGDEQVSDGAGECRYTWRIVCSCRCDIIHCSESSTLFPSSFQGVCL